MISSTSGDGIRQYTPKSMSGKRLQMTSLRKSSSMQKSKQSDDLVESIKKTVKQDPIYSQDVTKEILSTLPKSIETGSVGESIYGCAVQQSKNIQVECTPECISGIPLSSTKKCKVPIYVKSEGSLTKLNSEVGESAIVYLSDPKDTLTEKDLESLANDDVCNFSTYSKDKNLEYKKCDEVTISSTSLSRTSAKEDEHDSSLKSETSSSLSSKSKDDSSSSSSLVRDKCKSSEESSSSEEECSVKCKPKEKCSEKFKSKEKCDTKPSDSGYGWIFAVIAVVIIIIIGILVCWWFGVFSSPIEPTKTTCSESVTTKTTNYVPPQPEPSHCPVWC